MENEKKINLAKLKAFERPHAEKEITLCGEKQTITVYCLHDTTAIKMNALSGTDAQLKAMVLMLQDGLNISEDEARLLMDNELDTAVSIVAAIRDLTAAYMESRNTEKARAEKNLQKEPEASTAQ